MMSNKENIIVYLEHLAHTMFSIEARFTFFLLSFSVNVVNVGVQVGRLLKPAPIVL